MRSVALVIVHYRTIADTLECLESALRLIIPDGTSVRIILVDNASGDGSWSRILAWASRRKLFWHARFHASQLPGGVEQGLGFRFNNINTEIVLLRARENQGYAAGCNRGIEFALADPYTTHLWVLNSDLIFDQDALCHMLVASDRPEPAIYGSTLLFHDDPSAIQAAGGAVYWKSLGRSRHCGKGRKVAEFANLSYGLDYVVGAAMFFPREVIDKIGLLPEQFFIYFEETEWCARARDGGVDMIWVPNAHIIHKEGKSTGAADRFRKLSDLSFRYVVRNSLLFSELRYPLWIPTVLLFNLFECARYCFAGDHRKLTVFWHALWEYWQMRSSIRSYPQVHGLHPIR